MKLLQNIRKILTTFQRQVMNEGHTEQGVFMMLVFITDVIDFGLGLVKWRSRSLRSGEKKESHAAKFTVIAISEEIGHFVRELFKKTPIYVLKEEDIIDRVMKEKISRGKEGSNEVKFLGFDCEWVNDGLSGDDKVSKGQPVALLQLCTLSECFLIQMSGMGMHIPKALKQVLEDRSILKFGVGVDEDSKRLRSLGINVCGTVDIRFLIQRCQFKKDIIKHPERYKKHRSTYNSQHLL